MTGLVNYVGGVFVEVTRTGTGQEDPEQDKQNGENAGEGKNDMVPLYLNEAVDFHSAFSGQLQSGLLYLISVGLLKVDILPGL